MTFDHLKKQLAGMPAQRIAVVWPSDESTRGALAHALDDKLIKIIAIGALDEVKNDANLQSRLHEMTLVEAADGDDAARKAVAMVRQGQADAIMKGMINTDNLLRCVLNKEEGIMVPGAVLTHIAYAQLPEYPRLLSFTDAAVLPYPNEKQRTEQVRYVVNVARSLGIEVPKVALIHCTEKIDARHFPFTAQYPMLRQMAEDGEFGPCVVDGPFDVKVACSAAAMHKKHLQSPLNGESDALIFPEIESANAFYKTITLWCQAQTAGIVVGAQVPLIVASRGDKESSKYNSLLLAACVAQNKNQ